MKDSHSLNYRMDLVFDQDDQVWFVTFPELPGCRAHGATPEEAIAAVREVKELWLQTAKEKGEEIPQPQGELSYSGRLVLRLPKTLHERAAKTAEFEGVSLNQFLLSAIAEKIGAKTRAESGVQTQVLFYFTPTTAAVQQFTFKYTELAELLVRAQGIDDGHWGVFLKFGIQGGDFGTGPNELLPAAIVPILEIGIQRFDEPNALTVDASLVNRVAKPNQPMVRKKATRSSRASF